DARLGWTEAARSLEVRIVEQVPGLGDRRERQADALEVRREFVLGVAPHELGEPWNQPAALLDAHAVGLEAGVRRELRLAELAAEDLPLRVGDDADEELAILGLEDVVHAPRGALDRHWRRRLAGQLELGHVLRDEQGG